MENIEDTQYFYEDNLPDVFLIDVGENTSNDKGNKYVAVEGDKSNKYSYPPVHVEII